MNDDECMICLENIQDSDIAILNCKHYLHYKCLQDWCHTKQNYTKLCPICNTDNEIKNIVTIKKEHINTTPRTRIVEEPTPTPFFWCCQIL